MIAYSDFDKVEIRTGTIVKVEDFPEAKKPAYKVTIDFGDRGIKRSSAQITQLYSKEQLKGKQIVAVINFHPKQIGPFMSECLILGAVGDDGNVTLLQPEKPVDNGLRIA